MRDLENPSAVRKRLLAAAGAVGVLVLATFEWGLLPAARQWWSLRESVSIQAEKLARLETNLRIARQLGSDFHEVLAAAGQKESDERTLSDFLRELETQARRPGLTIVNIKPFPVSDRGSYKQYRVRLSMAGKLPEILYFAAGLMGGRPVVTSESFSIRGQQGVNEVECTFTICLVTLPENASRTPAQSVGNEDGQAE